MLDEVEVMCPYCGERFTTLMDTSIDQQEYIEDCQVCCNPIVFEVRLDTISGEPTLTTRRDND
ncbi:MAG: CPXCG motif-containing cysteine-rich protein [Gammaproteobacteria bacterium]|nr:CPXCG motif-containing cysteine-rich protein [Gammaproteobacteria bacterium]